MRELRLGQVPLKVFAVVVAKQAHWREKYFSISFLDSKTCYLHVTVLFDNVESKTAQET